MPAGWCRGGPSEGRACRVRKITFDNPFHYLGHDKHAPPNVPLGGTYLSGPVRLSDWPFGLRFLACFSTDVGRNVFATHPGYPLCHLSTPVILDRTEGSAPMGLSVIHLG